MKEILLNLLALVLTALTPDGGEIPPELQAEIDSLKEAINALSGDEAAEPATDEVTNSLLQRLTDLSGKIKNAAIQAPVLNKVTEAKIIALNAAMKAYNSKQAEFGKGIQKPANCNFDALIKNNGRIRILNANNANFAKTREDEFSIDYKLRQSGLLLGLKEITLEPGTNQILWTEGTRGANAAAVFAIGADRPSKTNTTATSTLATDTLGQQTTVAVQLLKAVNGVLNLYQDDLKGDIEDKIALSVAALIATAANPINVTVTCKTPNVADVIEVAYLQLKPYANGNRIAIAISTQQQKALNLLKDENGNKLNPIAYPDLDIVNFIATSTYTDDAIFGWVENTSVRFYNDGLSMVSDEVGGIGVSGDNFKKNQISIGAQYLNSAFVIRGTDVVTTIYDSIAATILELTAGA
jgi:hypothetical protein